MDSSSNGAEVADSTSDADFRRVRWVHIGLMLFVAYLAFGWSFGPESGGLAGAGDIREEWLWPLRVVLAVLAGAALITVQFVVRVPAQASRHKPLTVGAAGHAASAAVLRMAFSTAVAIYGLLLFILGGHVTDLLAFGAASLATLVWHFPTRSRWTRERATGEPES